MIKFGSKDRLYADLAQGHGEMALHYLAKALSPTETWADYEVGMAVQSSIEAWHFASRLIPDKLFAAIEGFLPRIPWTELGKLPPKPDPYAGLGSAVTGAEVDDIEF